MREMQNGDLSMIGVPLHADQDGQFVDMDWQLWHIIDVDDCDAAFIAKFSELWDLIEYAQEEFPYSHIYDGEQLVAYPMEERDGSIPKP